MPSRRRWLWVIATTILVSGRGTEAAAVPAPAPTEQSVIDAPPDTLISTTDGTIGAITDLMVVPNGSAYLTDRQANGIHVVDSAGRFVRTIGRQGAGPGEFESPSSLRFERDTLAVVDERNGRVQFLTLDGTALGTLRFVRSPISGTTIGPGWVTLSRTGGGYFPALGIESGELVVVRDAEGTVRARLGRGECVTPNPMRISEERDRIARGEIPCIMLNTAKAWASEDGALWMMLPSRAALSRFDAAGTLQWTREIQDPGFEAVHERFLEDNAGAEGMTMYSLDYLLDAEVVGADLWVLLGQSKHGPAVIRVMHADGSAGQQITFPRVTGAQLFAVDAARRQIYFVRPETADLLRSRF